ncbi:MAG: DUF1800 domain-containing protein [Candidatus Kapabacteria bacterium]|nr:DUF1800 domain-containing protein [Candidatus Kapabacteria bacterium]
MALLDAYTGPWTEAEAAHLLRRTTFGCNPQQTAQAASLGLTATLDALLKVQPAPEPPVDPTTGKTFVTGTIDLTGGNPGRYRAYVKAWWADLMATQPPSITEKLTLFWMNHFVVEATAVGHPQILFTYLAYMRSNALGNFKGMARQVTIEPAMLRYLNGNTNTKGNANENYARELQELFTIGKGPERASGDYTTYTERDVREAARVLTGWRDARLTLQTTFLATQHDTGDKQFSASYGNRIIKGRSGADAGNAELDELIAMIFDQQATRYTIVRKLYRWFVDCDITPDIEQKVIEPLGDLLHASDWNVTPVLRKLLMSRHFFSDDIRGAQLKSPADFVIGLLRSISYQAPTDVQQRYAAGTSVANTLTALQMDLCEPPSVAGYDATYQGPDYDRLWLNTATLPLRNGATDVIIYGQRGRGGIFDSIAYIKSIPNASDAYALVDTVVQRLFTVPVSTDMRKTLVIDVLQQGGRDYEWTQQWEEFLANEQNVANRNAVKAKLDLFFRYIFRMAEFQLL